MSALYDEDGIDGPADRAWARAMCEDEQRRRARNVVLFTRVEPVGQREGTALVCRRGKAEVRAVAIDVFPADDEARGTRLHDLRVSLDLNLRQAAKRVGISAADLSAVERGELRPSSEEEVARRLRAEGLL